MLVRSGNAAAVYDEKIFVPVERRLMGPGQPWFRYNYPPYYLFLLYPFSFLAYNTALVIFLACTLFLFIVTMRSICPDPLTARLALAFPGTLVNIGYGQNGLLSASLLGLGLLFMDETPLLAGILFALFAYKPHLAVVIPLALMAARKWKVLLATVCSYVALFGVSVAVFGLDAWKQYILRLLFRASSYGKFHLPFHKLCTFFGAFRMMGLSRPAALALHGFVAMSVLFILLFYCGKWRQDKAGYSAVLVSTCALLITPYACEYDLALVAVPMAFFVAQTFRSGCRFLKGERTLLAALWLVPYWARPLASFSRINLTPFLLLLMTALLIRRSGACGD